MKNANSVKLAVACMVAGALTVGVVQGTAVAKAASTDVHRVSPYLGKVVHGSSVSPVVAYQPPARSAAAPAQHLPAPGAFTVALTGSAPAASSAPSAAASATGTGWRSVGTSGLSVAAPVGRSSKVSQAKVEVLAPAAVQTLGLSGMVLRVSRADGVPTSSGLGLRIPANVVSGLYGADYASRVRWVELPSSATRSSLSRGVVRPVALTPAKTGDGSVQLTPQVAAAPMLVAATSSPQSDAGTGTWAATSLRGSGAWSVSTQAGNFDWSYPFRMPPAAAGPSPDVSLSYDSGSVDGQTASTNNQSSVVGDGWQLSGTGFIERSYQPCAKDGKNLPAEQAVSGDLCWNGEYDTVSFAGHSGALVATGTVGVYRIRGDDGSRVQYLPNSATCADGGHDNGCWQLTTQDGTQFFFGRSANSAWTVPVYGDDSADECHAATFAASVCTQDWRWNLDYVVDVHGNSETFSYTTETNNYHQNKGGLVSYVRGGSLSEIDYGRPSGSSAASDRVVFGYNAEGRCNTTGTNCALGTNGAASHPTSFPDVPWDQYCAAGDACTDLNAPTFWTNKLLNTVTTQALVSGTWTSADVWTLGHQFVNPGDTSAAALWLSKISHPGVSDTSFTPVSLNNRVKFDQYLPLSKQRIGDIHLDSGAIIAVTYDTPDCTPTLIASLNPATNSHQCFPQWWTPSNGALMLDWFNKYRVKLVTESPMTGGSSDTGTTTSYVYTSTPAWRLDSSPATLDEQRTWSAFAGYKTVEVRQGDPEVPAQQQTTDYQYFQGLDHDPDGTGSNQYRTVTLTGGGHSAMDSAWFAGRLFESTVRVGSSGGTAQSTTAVMTDTVTVPWAASSATQNTTLSFPNPASGGTGTYSATVDTGSYRVGDSTSYASSAVSTGGTRTLTTTTQHDSYGRVTSTQTQTPDVGTTCVATRYATDGTGHSDTALWLLDLPAEVSTVAVGCGATPAYPGDAVSDMRYYYDGATDTLSQPLTDGHLTRTDTVKSYSGSTPVFLTTASTPVTGYDALGRILQTTDVEGHVTTTSYTPAASGPLTSSTSTAAATATTPAMATTTTHDPLWGGPTAVTDPNGNLTTATYDSLGRRSAVWLPDRPLSTDKTAHTGTASIAYSYLQDATKALETTTTALNANGGTTASYAFADGLGRAIQTQVPMDGEDEATGAHLLAGTVLTDTFYDAAGRVRLTNNTYGTPDVMPSATLFNSATATQVPSQTQTSYDGAGRKTADITLGARADQTFGELWRTGYSYPGTDRSDVTPPAGGTASTTFTDSLGRTKYLDQYLGSTPTGTAQRTSYGYDPRGNMVSMTDPASATNANQWSWTFDVRGRQTKAVDPDTGTTVNSYDDAGNLTDTTDGAGNKLRYSYDGLDRKTGEFEYQTAAAGYAQVASWTYDTATLGKGLAASSSSYVGSTPTTVGTAYAKNITAYNANGKPLATNTVIPSWNGAATPAKFSSTLGYNPAGDLNSWTDPAVGGLPSERPGYVYDDFGNVTTVLGAVAYLVDAEFSHTNQPVYMAFSNGNTEIDRRMTYDDSTSRLTALAEITSASTNPHLAGHTYTYTNSGSLKSDSNVADGVATDTQCYVYDGVQELSEVWTPASNSCTTRPTVSTALGGPAPFWQTYSYDTTTVNRTSVVNHATTSTGTDKRSTLTYPAAGAARPHTVSSVAAATKLATATTWTAGATTAYGYNAAGETTSRPGQTLNWNAEGKLAKATAAAGAVSNIYDADGNLLEQVDPSSGTTLFLGDTELHIAPGSTTVTGTRTYTAYGMPIAERSTTVAAPTTSRLYWLDADPFGQGTAADEVDALSLAVKRRYLDPFGNTRGTAVTWTSSHTFLNAPAEATMGTVHLGARDYDSGLGRFLSADPVLDPSDSQQVNGYSYAGNDPVNSSDPSGLLAGCADVCTATPISAQGNTVGPAPGVTTSTSNPGVTVSPIGGGGGGGGSYIRYDNGVDGSDAGGAQSVMGVNIPRTKRTHVDFPSFLNGFAPFWAKHKTDFSSEPEYVPSWQDNWMMIQQYCQYFPELGCDSDDVWRQGGNTGQLAGQIAIGIGSMAGAIGGGSKFAGIAGMKTPGATAAGEARISFGPAPENAWSTYDRVSSTDSPAPGYKGGSKFKNDGKNGGQVLPQGDGVTYREWDVNPKVQGVDRGGERIVTGSDVTGRVVTGYYTNDHYGSFTQFTGPGG